MGASWAVKGMRELQAFLNEATEPPGDFSALTEELRRKCDGLLAVAVWVLEKKEGENPILRLAGSSIEPNMVAEPSWCELLRAFNTVSPGDTFIWPLMEDKEFRFASWNTEIQSYCAARIFLRDERVGVLGLFWRDDLREEHEVNAAVFLTLAASDRAAFVVNRTGILEDLGEERLLDLVRADAINTEFAKFLLDAFDGRLSSHVAIRLKDGSLSEFDAFFVEFLVEEGKSFEEANTAVSRITRLVAQADGVATADPERVYDYLLNERFGEELGIDPKAMGTHSWGWALEGRGFPGGRPGSGKRA